MRMREKDEGSRRRLLPAPCLVKSGSRSFFFFDRQQIIQKYKY